MSSIGTSFWGYFTPPLAVGLAFYGLISFIVLSRKFRSAHYGVVSVVFIIILTYSLAESILVFRDLIGLTDSWTRIVDTLQLYSLVPSIWAVPALAYRMYPESGLKKDILRRVTVAGAVLAVFFLVLTLAFPRLLIIHDPVHAWESRIGIIIYICGILLIAEIVVLALIFSKVRDSRRENPEPLLPYILALLTLLPFGLAEMILQMTPPETFPLWFVNFPILIGGFLLFSAVITIGSQRFAVEVAGREREASIRLEHEIWFDSLTGLPNRRRFRECLDRRIRERDGNQSDRLALILIDLDDFRSFNDTYGIVAGDELLVETAARLSEVIRDHDELYRLGGDEFAIILNMLRDTGEAANVTARLIEAFADPVHAMDGSSVFISASAGIAAWPYDGTSSRDLMKHADAALNRAKKQRNAFRTFSPDMTNEASERIRTIHTIKTALIEDLFYLKYQPVTDKDGSIVGAEALIRIKTEDVEMMPDRFIPIAESTGLINPVGDWVIERAIADRSNFSGYPSDFYFSINLSVKQLRDINIVRKVNDAVVLEGLKPEMFRFEITESSLMENYREVLPAISSFRSLGYKLSLDDFGTGYSSLAYLMELPVDILKLDRAFLKGMQQGPQGQAIVTSLLLMAKGLHLEVVVEGIETANHRDYLAGFEGVFQQGFFHGRPMMLESLDNLMKKKND